MFETIFKVAASSITGSAIGGVGITPLMARANKGNFTWIIIPVIIIAVAVGVWLLWKKASDARNSPEWVKRNRERPTNKNDVAAAAKRIKLNAEQTRLLWKICHENAAPNIYYLSSDKRALRELFRKAYAAMKSGGSSVGELNKVFRLLYRIEFSETIMVINSSASIPSGIEMTFVITRDMRYSCNLKDNTPDTMTLSIPRSLADKADKPSPLSKVLIDFSLGDGMSYSFETRIVRYGKGIDGKPEVVLQNTVHNIKAKEATREAKRMDMNVPCTFSAVKEAGGKFETQEKKYPSKLDNISADGCCIISNLPIKKGQYISVALPLDQRYNVIGTIVQTRKNSSNGSFFLHIKFVQIDDSVRNKIFERIYNFGANDITDIASMGEGV